jgi:tetratricopeptide (TPR) repeat protein
MQSIVARFEAPGSSENQQERLSPVALLWRAVDAVLRSANLDDPTHASRQPAVTSAESMPTQINFHLDFILKAVDRNDDEKAMAGNARALLALAELYRALGDNAAAVKVFRRWLQHDEAQRDVVTRGQAQLQLGSLHADLGDWQAATQAIEESQAILTTARDLAGLVSAQIVLGRIAYKQGKYPVAGECFEKALQFAEESNDVRRIATTRMELGVIARMQGRSHHALACFQDALIYFQSAHDSAGAAECLNHLGVLHLQNERLREAESCIDKAIALCRENGWAQVLAFGYLNKAAVHIAADDGALAATTWGKGLELVVRLQNQPGLAKASRLCAQILVAVDEPVAAREFLDLSIQLYEKFSIPLGLANCYLDLARLMQSHDEKAATDYSARARAIFESLGLPAEAQLRPKRLRQIKRKPSMTSLTLEEI